MHISLVEPPALQSRCRPVPVLLAASRQRRLWPLSTPSLPFCLREIDERSSLLMRNLQAIEATAAYERPIVILMEEAYVRGSLEVQRIRPDATIIVVPAGTGSGISSVLAALNASENALALIPASFTADNPVEAFAFLASQMNESRKFPVMLASRATSARDGMYIELGSRRPTDTALFELQNLHIRGNGEFAAALELTASLAKACGPVAMPAQYLIDRLKDNWPTLLSACRNALSLKQQIGPIVRPHGDFLRLAGRPGIRDLLQAVLPEVTAILGKPDWRTIQTFRDPIFDRSGAEPSVPVGVSGYPDHRVIVSQDGILVLKPGHEDEPKQWYPDNEPTRRETPGRSDYPSFRFSA